MMKSMTLGFAGFALVMAVGCGTTIVEPPDPTGGSGGNTSSSGATDPCEGFDDEQGTADVIVRFRNETTQPIYLPSLCAGVSYSIAPLGGDDGVTYRYEGSCLQTCEDLQTDSPIACGACAQTAYLVPAGGSLEVTWNGTGLRGGAQMPAQCFAFPEAGGTCSQIVAAPSGTYRVDVAGYAECGNGTEACVCHDGGECEGEATGATAYPDPAMFDFPGAGAVDVVFGVCAFGCPEG
jgi:hypothetical protein